MELSLEHASLSLCTLPMVYITYWGGGWLKVFGAKGQGQDYFCMVLYVSGLPRVCLNPLSPLYSRSLTLSIILHTCVFYSVCSSSACKEPL